MTKVLLMKKRLMKKNIMEKESTIRTMRTILKRSRFTQMTTLSSPQAKLMDIIKDTNKEEAEEEEEEEDINTIRTIITSSTINKSIMTTLSMTNGKTTHNTLTPITTLSNIQDGIGTQLQVSGCSKRRQSQTLPRLSNKS